MAFSFDSESPIRDILASKTIRPWGGSSLKRRKEMEGDITRDQNQAENINDRNAANMEQKSAIDREKRMEQIKGEPGDQYNTRMQNQAWNPDAYGKKYQSQFDTQEQQGASPGAEIEDEMEKRRRRRMSMASAFSGD